MGNEETPALPPEKLTEYAVKQEAIGRAQADPLPGPLTEAFAKGALKVGDVYVRKFVARDFRTLKLLDHPLLEMIKELQQTNGTTTVEIDEDSLIDLAFIFSRPPKESWEIANKGKDYFRQNSQDAFLDTFTSEHLKVIGGCVFEQLRRAWQTAIKYSADLQEGGEVTFFRDAGVMKMASAGG